ncbi:MAG: hypothetical protein QOF21_1747 [Actinomycetota bacterium]
MRVVFLHAFPLDGRMWQTSADLWPDASVAPTLYGLGETMTSWANRVLAMVPTGRLVLVGCSMGGSCALEMVRVAGDRVAALVLVGSKAAVRYEPDRRDGYIEMLRTTGIDGLWPDLGPVGDAARHLAHQQSLGDLERGVRAFHTRPDAADVLRGFRGEVLVVRGEHDLVGRSRPAAHVVAGAGHYVNLDQSEAFNQLLVPLMRDG